MRRTLFALFLLIVAAPLIAQEFDFYDLNDFVAPSLHGALYDPRGNLTDRGDVFRIVRVVTGGVSGYAWRNTPADDKVGFVQVVGSEYAGNFQANVKATFLDGHRDNTLPQYRVMTQFAHYMLHAANTEAKDGGTEWLAGRAMVSVAIAENRLDAITGGRERRFNTEFAAEFDVPIILPGGLNASGSIIWTSRESALPGKSFANPSCAGLPVSFPCAPFLFQPGSLRRTQRASYYHRVEDRTIAGRYHFGLDLSVGGEKTERWRWGVTRASVRGAMDVRSAGTLNVAWMPAYTRPVTGKHVRQEVAIFIDRTVFASLARGSRRE
jgi:hypothetical protein